MTQLRKILWLAIFLITLLLLPLRAAAQSATVTDEAFLSSNPTTQQANMDGQGVVLIVAGSSATVGSTSVGTTKTYIKFQLQSSLPPLTAASNVAKATLKLFLSRGTNPSGAIDIYPITGAWTESKLSPSTPPGLASSAFATAVPVGKADSFVVVDLTQLVQEWLKGSVNGGIDNDGIALVADTSTTYVVFDTRKNTATSHEPRLEIVLVDSGPQEPQGPAGAAGAAATVTVGTTTTVSANTPALVTNAGNSNAALLNFQIPQGPPGPVGPASALTGVLAGTDLTGGGATGNVTLNLNVAATDARYAQLGAANTFSANQTVSGNLFASGPITSGNSLGVFRPSSVGGVLPGTSIPVPVFIVDPFGNLTNYGNASIAGNLNTGGTLSIDSPGTPGGRFTVLSNGNVGIGNPNPGTNLDVTGIIRANTLISTGPVQIGGDIPMNSNPHMSFSGAFPFSFCGTASCGNPVSTAFLGPVIGGSFVPDRNIQITRISYSLASAIDPSCGATGGLSIVLDGLAMPPSFGLTWPTGTNFGDTGPISISVNAAQTVLLVGVIGTGNCTYGSSGGGYGVVNVQYVMQ